MLNPTVPAAAGGMPKPMTIEEMQRLVLAWTKATPEVKAAALALAEKMAAEQEAGR